MSVSNFAPVINQAIWASNVFTQSKIPIFGQKGASCCREPGEWISYGMLIPYIKKESMKKFSAE